MGNSVTSSFIWKFFERFSAQGINLIVQIALARIIAPEAFGALAILTVFVNIASIFVQKGIGTSLIRQAEIDDLDCDSAFWMSELVAALLFAMMVLGSSHIAAFFHVPDLSMGLVAISTSLFFGGLSCIQNSLLVRDMKFKAIFYRGLIASLISGAFGIGLAVAGCGLWALIAQTLSNQMVLIAVMWAQLEWRPSFRFSFTRLKTIFNFGGSVLASELLSYLVEAARSLFIGREFSAAQLSYYDRGQTYPATLMRGIYDTVGGVLLPVFSKLQKEPEKLANECARYLGLVFYIVTPAFVIFAASSEAVLVLLLTEKWQPAAAFCTLFCIAQVFQPIQGVFRQAIYAVGRSPIILRIEVVKDVFSIVLLICAIPFGPLGIAVSFVVTMAISAVLMGCGAMKLLPLSFRMVANSIWKTVLTSVLTFVVLWCLNGLISNLLARLIAQVLLGIGLYLALSAVIRDRNLAFFLSIVRGKLAKTKGVGGNE